MSIHIELAAQRQSVYTNLDKVAGRVVLHLNREEAFSAINVKLEGEARTRLAHPLGTRSGDRGETELEVHKLLYFINTVFPTNPVLGAKSYTLPPGRHVFPFTFKIPFNNACNANNIKRLKMGGLQLDMRDMNQHVKRTLPPTLGGFPGEAEIKYFVKVTAERPAFYKENFRALAPFKFLPIDPPRLPPGTGEIFGLRKHQFAQHHGLVPSKTGMFRKPSIPDAAIPPLVSVDARLPNPAIITCNDTLPLRVLITKLNASPEAVFLRTFHVTLWAHTRIRAHMLERTEVSSWVLCSYANMNVELKPEPQPNNNSESRPNAKDGNGNPYPILVDRKLWSQTPLPPSVPPSFDCCNLSRWYELEISVGLSWGSTGHIRPELTVQPIRLKVHVFSGIAPSPALVSAAQQQAVHQQHQLLNVFGGDHLPVQPPRPGQTVQTGPTEQDPGAAGPSSALAAGPAAPPYEEPDAPPSYEDAMAEDLAPVEGPRREYQVADSAPVTDGKRRNS